MKLKKIILTVAIVLSISSINYAQFAHGKLAVIDKMKQAGVLLAVTDDDEFNKKIEEIMAVNWTASKYKVIKRSELDGYVKSNPENFIITYLRNQEGRTYGEGVAAIKSAESSRNPSGQQKTSIDRPASIKTIVYKDVLLLLSDVKNSKKIEQEGAMFKCFMDEELELVDQIAEFTREISTMNNLLILPDLKEEQFGILKMARNYPTANPKKIINQELWIAESDVDKKDEAKMNKIYPYKYKIVTKQEIADAINSRRKDVVYLSYIVFSETVDSNPLKITIGSKKRPAEGLYLVQDAEKNQILTILSAVTNFDSRYLGVIKAQAEKTK